MPMTVTDAKSYIAGIIGGSNDPKALIRAAEALARAYTDWEIQKFWTFLLKDTRHTTLASAGTITNGVAVVAPLTTGAFDFVNIGQTVTVTADGSPDTTLAADTTVSSYTRGSDGVITSITLSNAFAVAGGGSTTSTGVTLTFSADIPLRDSVGEYNVPLDFAGGYTSRLIDGPMTPVKYVDQRWWDKITLDQTLTGVPEAYTTYNPISEGAQNFGTSRLQVFKTPDGSYTLRLRYFRRFNQTGTYIDVPDQYLYQFLDYASSLMLTKKRAQDDPNAFARQTQNAFEGSQQADEQPNDDDDGDIRLKSPYEQGADRPIVGNGSFDPYPI